MLCGEVWFEPWLVGGVDFWAHEMNGDDTTKGTDDSDGCLV
jgi:hypothetical protein